MTVVQQTSLRRGLDHAWFPFRPLSGPASLALKPGKTLAVTLVVPVQHYPLNAKPPFAIPGGLERPYPDIGTYSQREVGHTDGLWRIADLADALSIPLSLVVERQALYKSPDLKAIVSNPRHAVVAGGEHAVHMHTSAMDPSVEAGLISHCLAELGQAAGRPIQGWRSPYCSQSPDTLRLLANAGVRYVGDFANDDRPFTIDTGAGPIWSVPMNHYYSDLHFIQQCRQPVQDYVDCTLSAVSLLQREGGASPAVLSLVVHPWLMGVTHRIAALKSMLATIAANPGVQVLNTDQVFDACIGKA